MKDTEELIKDLKLKDSSVRRHAIEMLGIMGDEKAVDALILVLKDKNRFVRQEAIAALGKILLPLFNIIPLILPLYVYYQTIGCYGAL